MKTFEQLNVIVLSRHLNLGEESRDRSAEVDVTLKGSVKYFVDLFYV